MAGDLSFSMPRETGVFVCAHVWEQGRPILYVSHDGDGDWQFLCGGDHEDSDPIIVCLEHVIDRDSTVNETARLRCNNSAEREVVGGEWQIVDWGEEKLRADIANHGWHVVAVRADDEGPGFAYSVGMKETFGQPEIIMFGLSLDLMGRLINDLGAMVRAGRALVPGEIVEELIRDGHCELRSVTASNRLEFLRYASWYYGDGGFEAIQCFWPSKTGLFPWDPEVHEDYVALQPDLSKPE